MTTTIASFINESTTLEETTTIASFINESTTLEETEKLTCTSRQSITSSELLEILQNGSSDFKATMYAPIPFLIIMIGMFIDLVIFLIRNSVSWKRTRYLIWIVSVYPVLASTCFIGIYMPRSSVVITFGRSFYFSFVLVKFFKLVIHYYGGKEGVEVALKGDKVVPANPFPCCFVVCCCRNQPMTVSRINKIRWTCYQALFVFPVSYFFQTLLAADDLILRSPFAAVLSFVFQACIIISSLTCLYGFTVIAKSSRFSLQQFFIRGKYLSISLVIACDTLQEFFIKIADRANELPCGFPYPDREKVFLWHSYILFYELFLISILGWFSYRRSDIGCHYVIEKEPESNLENNFTEVYAVKSPIPDDNYAHVNGSDVSLQRNEKYLPSEMTV